ncbi:MAG: UDP-glucose/GDP-mannose dehydrogenase family protein [Candidatus Magasanikbacteria bacterium]|nr:UDP-glucose/GDP-mannose dehydrogenase family protein [Candidatus Magasanikbacteria bacterium]
MNILYIGGGFVGACSAAVSADSGHQTLVYDLDERKVQLLSANDRDTVESCLFEEGLGDLLIRNRERIIFTTDYARVAAFLDTADAVFLCVPTPEIGATGESDLRYYFAAAEKLAETLAKRNAGRQDKYVVIVNKSTVPIELVDQTESIMRERGVENFGVVSNPEFLVEGKAIEGSIRPDRVVVGASREKDFAIMRQVYRRFYDATGISYLEVTPTEAAAGKLLANFCLFNRLAVSFDVVGRTCESFSDIRYEQIRKILTTDPRIGSWGFYNSLYAGGSCFGKDARSLAHQLRTAGENGVLVDETYLANQRQLERFLGRAEKDAAFSWTDKTVALLGLAFKQDTNDVRNSPATPIVNFLREQRVRQIRAYDPTAMENFKGEFPPAENMVYGTDEWQTMAGSDVIIIATDWPQLRGLADTLPERLPGRPLIMDGRRLWHHRYADLQAAGFSIIAVGSPFLRKV